MLIRLITALVLAAGLSPDGQRAYVTNYNSWFLSAIEGFQGVADGDNCDVPSTTGFGIALLVLLIGGSSACFLRR